MKNYALLMKLVEFYASCLKECYEVIKLSEDVTLPAPLPAPLLLPFLQLFKYFPNVLNNRV